MVKGLALFAERFAGEEDRYVLIGGVAAYLLREDAGLAPRATKDLDIVLCVETLSADFARKMWAFIQEGGYEIKQVSDSPRRFYRFAKPADDRFPIMLEFFSRAPDDLVLAAAAELTPVPIGESVVSLSAILLDDDDYAFIQDHMRLLQGVNIVSEQALIPLKAFAWLDLRRRKADGENIDDKDIRKHRSDVFRLYQLLVPDRAIPLPERLRVSMARFIEANRGAVDAGYLKNLEIRGETGDTILDTLAKIFGAQA